MNEKEQYPKRYDEFFDLLIKLEGGLSNHPKDKGGKTNYGITKPVLDKYNYEQNQKINIDTINLLQAKHIYFTLFYKMVRPVLKAWPHYHYFDLCVNSGFSNYQNCLKTAGNTPQAISRWRVDFYHSIVLRDASQKIFLRGWLNRITTINDYFSISDSSRDRYLVGL